MCQTNKGWLDVISRLCCWLGFSVIFENCISRAVAKVLFEIQLYQGGIVALSPHSNDLDSIPSLRSICMLYPSPSTVGYKIHASGLETLNHTDVWSLDWSNCVNPVKAWQPIQCVSLPCHQQHIMYILPVMTLEWKREKTINELITEY